MKEFHVMLKNEKGEILPKGDVETLMIAMYDIPLIGDYVIIDDEENTTENDQTSYLNLFCLMELGNSKSSGWRFKVVGRTFLRSDGESWICIELQYEPLTN
jgi:hypothetical protein